MQEHRLEEILKAHPYLIDDRLLGIVPISQERMGASRLDLRFELAAGSVLVELKKTALKPANVEQLLTYCGKWARHMPLLRKHYLIGYPPTDREALIAPANESKFTVIPKYIGEDIPLYIVFDAKLKRYRAWREGVDTSEGIHLR